MYGIYIYINKYPKDDAVVYTVLSENRIPHYIHWLYNQKMTVCLGESPISKQSQLSYDCWLHIFHCILTIIPLYYYLNTSKYQFSLPFPNSRLCFIIILPWLSHDYFCTRHIYSIYIYIRIHIDTQTHTIMFHNNIPKQPQKTLTHTYIFFTIYPPNKPKVSWKSKVAEESPTAILSFSHCYFRQNPDTRMVP